MTFKTNSKQYHVDIVGDNLQIYETIDNGAVVVNTIPLTLLKQLYAYSQNQQPAPITPTNEEDVADEQSSGS